MMKTKFTCSYCNTENLIQDSKLNKITPCLKCKKPHIINAKKEKIIMLSCQCGFNKKIDSTMLNKEILCPTCYKSNYPKEIYKQEIMVTKINKSSRKRVALSLLLLFLLGVYFKDHLASYYISNMKLNDKQELKENKNIEPNKTKEIIRLKKIIKKQSLTLRIKEKLIKALILKNNKKDIDYKQLKVFSHK